MNFIIFWDFSFCPKLCWSSGSDTFRKQIDTNKNKIQTHVWTLTVQFHLWQIMFELKSFFFFMSASNPFWFFFLSSNLEFVLRTFFLNKSILDCIFWSPIWINLEGFWEQVDERAFWILFLIPSRFWIYFRVQTGFGFSFCVQIPFGLNVLSSNTFCIFWGAQVQIHFGFCLWVQFHLGFFQSWKINFGISVLKF